MKKKLPYISLLNKINFVIFKTKNPILYFKSLASRNFQAKIYAIKIDPACIERIHPTDSSICGGHVFLTPHTEPSRMKCQMSITE